MQNWKFSQIIINWQHYFGRNNLPWQKNNNPYYIWISEIMLQQTQVKTVIPYFNKFITQFNNIKSLSKSNLNKILYLWSGLGYYNRANNIYKTAKIIINNYNGNFPNNFNNLIKLPGIGKTTAHAILSLSYNFSFPILDGNVKRILIRFYNLKIENSKKKIHENKLWKIINQITPIHNAKKFNQGMMDLGALICTYKKPKCYICPLKNSCQYDNTINIQKNIKKNKIKKKTIFYMILQYKNFIVFENRKKRIWNKLFCFPEFNNLKEMQYWLLKNNIFNFNYKKYFYKIHKLSHLKIKMIFINIKIKKKIKININKNKCWYNLKKKIHIGIPKPIYDIIIQLHK